MRSVLLSGLSLFVGALAGQKPAPVVPMRPQFEYLRPFRSPDKNLQPPLELYEQLRVMQGIARAPGQRVTIDQEGREVCDSAAWKEARAKAEVKAARMGGYLAIVCQESGAPADRSLGFYGSYWIDSIQDTIAIMSLIPGEPVASIREEAMQRALPFLKVHLAKTRGGEGEVRAASPVDHAAGQARGGRVFDDPNAAVYDFDINPWCALLECEEPRDQAQGLWFLREVIAIRPAFGPASLELVQSLLPPLVVHDHSEVRRHARAYLAAIDPKQRPAPAEDAPVSDVQAWLASILYEVFPPIRRVSAGLVELYPSADLDEIVATGKDLLARDAIGSTASGTAGGVFYRGFKVQRLPAPLDRLGVPKDAVITRINGLPVTESKEVLAAIERFGADKQAMMVEFVAKEQVRAIEFRLK
jgi:hypothetical protein